MGSAVEPHDKDVDLAFCVVLLHAGQGRKADALAWEEDVIDTADDDERQPNGGDQDASADQGNDETLTGRGGWERRWLC